eukprot:gnl/MRDRNA2_/MRDRNA2_83364_c0_seq2.p1 gnl/MRDRNA2_/MRDRNA2_83364_c0~~gnl/MRDRNA2_/MRDRNA2_83364_c0_seq2.p1  ORF type:complete len:322 (-),score=71.97 gnl/MRDRNA2_/MRDRNA2_83364_c0_seq2:568-1422(-)
MGSIQLRRNGRVSLRLSVKMNEYVMGLCNRMSCPLANSNYATIIEKEGVCYLYMQTAERARSPKNLWEKIELSKNYREALEQIASNMEFDYHDHQINRCKQRLTKIRQMSTCMRKLAMKDKTKSVPIALPSTDVQEGSKQNKNTQKMERREKIRELKAEAAAKVELAIERQLLERLKHDTYGNIYKNSPKVLESTMENRAEIEVEQEAEEDDEDKNAEYIEGLYENSDEDDGAFIEGFAHTEDLIRKIRRGLSGPAKKKRKSIPHVEIEFEEDMDAFAVPYSAA